MFFRTNIPELYHEEHLVLISIQTFREIGPRNFITIQRQSKRRYAKQLPINLIFLLFK